MFVSLGNPILHSQHWDLDEKGMPTGNSREGRRASAYIMPIAQVRRGRPDELTLDVEGKVATNDEVNGSSFLARSEHDPHQFRFIVSPEDSARLADLKPFIRDLLSQMERDLETKLDWVAVDHFNTGHPHTHVVIRGRDDQGGTWSWRATTSPTACAPGPND